MLTLARLVVIPLLPVLGLAESAAAQSSTAQVISSILEELLDKLQVDEIIGDVGEGHVLARGSMVQRDDLVHMGVVVECDGDNGSMIIRDPVAATQDLYPVDRTFCDALVKGLRERDRSSKR
jgi:hypothetical protein